MLSSTGERYKNFIVTQYKPIPEIQSTLIELIHEPTGAEIIQIKNDDDENLFNLSFRTHPEKSNGVAHILEHVVLCGSKKFPIRDPFFGMTRRSLNTFMNALTGSDFTCYPASSQVPQDFYNLLDVYLDAVFHPNLSKLSFLQEGHRLEFLTPEDPNSPLLFKGIVFNEMKGAMNAAEARLGHYLMSALFPDLTYGVNSGGDPKEIPSLTYDELKSFHEKFYHPSRCLFYFYGNLPIEDHLDFLEEHLLKDVQKAPQIPLLPKQPRFQQKKVETHYYPIPEEEDLDEKTLVGLGWLTCSILDQENLLALTVLDVALTGTDAAPLKKALLKSGLCKQADAMIEDDMSEIPFLVVCKGCGKENGYKIEEVVRSTLERLTKKGIAQNLIEGAIHQIEMSRSEITGNSSPYGLSLFWRSALLKQHGGNPEDGLKIHTLFQHLRDNIKDQSYFPKLIEKYFLKNPHFVRIEMHPDKTLAAKEIEEEKAQLTALCSSLDDKGIKNIIEEAKALSKYQVSKEEESLDVLPKVSLKDIQKEGKEFPLRVEDYQQFKLFHHPCFTNGLTYADLIFDLPHLEKEDLPILRLFTLLLPQMGCGGRSYEDHLDYLLEHTGGLKVSLDLCLQVENPNHMRPFFSLRGKALNRKLDRLFPIFKEMIISPDFTDKGRIQELLMQHLHGLENSIHHHSLRYAVNLAARGFSAPSTIISYWHGLDYFWTLKKIVEEFETHPESLIKKLETLKNQILGLKGPHLVLSCEETCYQNLKQNRFYGLDEIPANPFPKWKGEYEPIKTLSQARVTASPVAFTAMLFPSLSYVDPRSPALSIASELMENMTLHTRIREQGGAYGSGAVNSPLSGQFYFYAYRDPHLASTLEAFQEAVQTLVNGEFDEVSIEEAKLGLFQEIDSPIPPGSRAITTYLRERGGRTPEKRQAFREGLLTCQKEQIRQAAKQVLQSGLEKGVVVSFAGKEFLEKENALLQTKALPIFSI